MNIAVIPARGGSKRIPRKNIKDFCGKPIIAYSIEAALGCSLVDKVIVSTDDSEIAEISKEFGAEVPFIRPGSLSGDLTATVPVIKHAIEFLKETEIRNVLCLYPTAPFVRSEILTKAYRILQSSNLDYVFSSVAFEYPVQRGFTIEPDNTVAMLQPQYFEFRSQDLQKIYHDAGQFYWGTKAAWVGEKVIFSNRSQTVELPRTEAQDIDLPEDWELAEILYKYNESLFQS